MRTSRALELVDSGWGVAAAFLAALGVWWLQAVAMPLGPGRDIQTYLGAYVELFQRHPIDLGYVLGRSPLAGLVTGGLLDLAGGALAEPVMSLLFALSITAWFLAARRYGPLAGLVTAVLLLAYPGYGILFHTLASDSVFAAAFAGWSLLAQERGLKRELRELQGEGCSAGVMSLLAGARIGAGGAPHTGAGQCR